MAQGKDIETLQTARALLDLTGEALLTGDFFLMKSCFALPYAITTVDGKYVIETEQEMHLLFKNMRAEYARQGVTRLDRTVLSAERVSDTLINSTHIAQQYAGDQKLKEPFPVVSTITRVGKEWRIATGDYAVEAGSRHSRVLNGKASNITSLAEHRAAPPTPSQTGAKK